MIVRMTRLEENCVNVTDIPMLTRVQVGSAMTGESRCSRHLNAPRRQPLGGDSAADDGQQEEARAERLSEAA
ncbi:MAG: hypothetical protein KY395_06980, partial [Actinobacteria bacterium]|nr:hypothetical protein [Actinomycetota bacterium]